MRRIWRLARMMAMLVTHTSYLSLTVRRLPKQAQLAYRARRQQVALQVMCRILKLRISVVGTLPSEAGLLIVCNHLGLLDPVVLASQVPLAFAGKAELRDWPFIGWICREVAVIFVERERPTQTSTFVRDVQARLRNKVSVLVFPEGTTSPGETVKPFKTGAFQAVAGLDGGTVLPMCLKAIDIEGVPAEEGRRQEVTWADDTQSFTGHCWHLLGLKHVHMQLRIGVPFSTMHRDRKELARLAHDQVHALYHQERNAVT